MGKWVVYRKDSSSPRCIVGKIEYNGEWMGACNVTTTVTSPTPINFELGDYIIYRGERFEINYDPTVIKSSSNNTYGEGYKYENVVFNSLSDELVRCGFLDYVLNDNKIHYSSLPNFSFYASNVKDLAENIQANLDRIYTGANKWTVVVHPEFKGRENINVSVNSINCWEALALAKTLFDANFIVKGREITIGTEGIAVDKIFSYGKGNGLLTVERNTDSSQKIITRLRAYGSTRNMPLRYYYNNEEGAPNNLSVQNLMLPSFPTDPDPYIDSSNINELGVREGTVFFDGSNELPEIYPTMEGMTADILEQAGVIVNASGRLDVIVQAEQIEDDGVEVEGMPSTFKVNLKDIGFDLNDYGEATMSMKNGMCGGRDFKVISCEDIGDGYMLECERTRDDGLDLYFPNKNYNIRTGDEFVFLDIEMPEVYIKVASQRLLNEATAYLNKNCYVKYTYTPEIDNIYLARQHEDSLKFGGKSIYMTIKEGDMFLLEDDSLGFDERIIISNLNIVEDDKSDIPQYKVVLSNEKSVGAFDKIQEQIKAIATGGGNSDQLRSLIKTYGSVIFLRKDQDDRSRGKIASNKGFEVGRYVSGSSGAIAYLDKLTGKTVAEVDKLYVRMKAYFETLVIKEANSISGKHIISPAGAVRLTDIANGEWKYDEKGEPLLDEEENHIFIPYDGFVRCYFLAEQDGERINYPFEIGDQIYCQLFNAFTGEGNGISNKYYWRLLVNDGGKESVKFNNKICYYFDLSNTICDTGSDMPNVGDIVCQRGNIKDLDRQNFLEFSSVDAFSPSITLFQGVGGRFNEETGEWIADYTLTDKEMVQFAVNKSTGRAFMNLYGDMYVGGRFTVDANGSLVEPKSYLRYTQENGLEIKGKISAQSIYGDSNKTFGDYFNDVLGDIEGIQKQIDGAIESFFYEYAPTLDNYPASEWITDELKESHLNDTFTNLKDGRSWRWTKSDGVYSWTEITDTATVEALRKAGEAQDTADGKRKVYVGINNPTTPYDKGDLWSRGSAYPLLVCINPKKADQFFERTDWVNADNIDEVSKELEEAKKQFEQDIKDNAEDLKTLSDLLQDTKDYLDGAFKDGIIDSNEKSAISKYINQIETIQAEVEASYTEVYNNELLLDDGNESTAKQNLATAYDKLILSITDLIETINSVIADNKADGDEIASVDFKYEAFNQKYGDYIKALNAARNYIESKLNGKIDQNIEDLGGYAYLKDALKDGKTLMNGGLIQSSILALGKFDNEVGSFTVWSGTSGIYDETKIGGGIASWYGGGNIDLFDYASYDNIGNASFSVPEGVRVAAGADRMDGTGYRANGNLWWDKDGKVHADALSFFVGEESVGKILASFQPISDNDGKLLYIIPQAPFQNLQVTDNFTVGSGDNKVAIKYDKDNNALYVVKPDGSPVNFYATGGISMYGEGDTTVRSVMDLITNNLDPSTLAVHNGLITVIGNTGSEGVSESAVRNIVEGYGFLTDVPSEYITESELASKDYAGKDWVKEYVVDINTGNITAITKQMVIDALGYTPYDNANPNGYVTSESIPSLDGYATEDWVIKKGYLTSIPSEYITESELTAKGYATALSVNTALGDKVDKVDGKGLSTEDFTTALKTKLEGLNNYNDTAISNAVTKLRSDFDALVEGDTSTAIDNFNEIIAFLNGVQDNQDLSSIIASIEQQIAAKYTKPSGGIPKSDLVQAVQTSLGKADSALQSHQSIYTLTFQSGTFASGSFTANSGNKTINIPTTTSHVSEGSNLYFTNARAVSALGDTLKSYVTLSGSQTVSGEKNFTGGLKVNGSPIVYDAAKKYWKLEGDLLITGGLTMYGSDSSFTPSTIMDAIDVDGTTISKEGGVLRVIGGGSGSISEITKQMVIDALGFTPYSAENPNGYITSATLNGYLPLSGGTIKGDLIIGSGDTRSWIHYFKKDMSMKLGAIGVSSSREPLFDDITTIHTIIHSGNIGSYALKTDGSNAMTAPLLLAYNFSLTEDKGIYVGKSNMAGGAAFDYASFVNIHDGSISSLQLSWHRSLYEPKIAIRISENSNWSAWKTVAFTDSNVASATKLQTPRTIWGQHFDGSGDVNGNITINVSAYPGIKTISSIGESSHYFESTNTNQGWAVGTGVWSVNGFGIGEYKTDRKCHLSIIKSSGNVGIGTTNPLDKLHVEGNGKFSGSVTAASFNGTATQADNANRLEANYTKSVRLGTNGAINEGWVRIAKGINGYRSQFIVQLNKSFSNGRDEGYTLAVNFTIQGASITQLSGNKHYTSNYIPRVRVEIVSESTCYFDFYVADYTSYNDYSYSVYGPANTLDAIYNPAVTGTIVEFETSNGVKSNNGFTGDLNGTATQADKLSASRTIWGQSFDGTGDVKGNINLNTSFLCWHNDPTNYSINGNTGNLVYTGFYGHKFCTRNGEVLTITDGGNVGIGTTNPLDKLHVAGNLRLKNEDSFYGNYIYFGDDRYCYIGEITDDSMTIYASKGIQLNGKVNIASDTTIDGNLLVSGGITMYSQRSLKNVVDEKGLSLEELRTIKPTRYTWKDGRDNRIHFGGIADDIQQVLPEVVYNANGVLTMDYGNAGFAIASSLIKPVIDHENEITSLKRKVRELEEEVKRLKSA